MAEHTCMDKLEANIKRFMESMKKSHIRSKALFEQIKAQLEALFQQHNLSLSSLHGAANSSKETVQHPCQLQKEITTPESLNIALLASDEILPSTEPIEEQFVTDEDSVGRLVITESLLGILEPPLKREAHLSQCGSEVTMEKTPSFSRTMAAIQRLEQTEEGALSGWWCTTESSRLEKMCTSSMRKCFSHVGQNNPMQSPMPKPPDWIHDAVKNTIPPPEPPDLTCGVIVVVFAADKYDCQIEFGAVADASGKIKWEEQGTMPSRHDENGCRYLYIVGGVIDLAPGYLSAVYGIIKNAGGLLIDVEVQSGIGPTVSHFWGIEGHRIIQDGVAMAKGVGNGAPIGAVVTTLRSQ